MKSARMKRNFWLNSEIDCMLKIFQEIQLLQKSAMTNHCTFVQIANSMRRRGFFNKTADQIKRKWFQMKSAYLCYKKGNVHRLLLIPERFRPIIAKFVEFENKSSTLHNEDYLNIRTNLIDEKKDNLQSGNDQVKSENQNLWEFLIEYNGMQKALLKAELQYQYVRDMNWCNHLSFYSESNKSNTSIIQ